MNSPTSRPRTETPTVSVVVPARNECASISALIGSIVAQSYPTANLEIVLVDGQSEDRTIENAIAAAEAAAWTVLDGSRSGEFVGGSLAVVANPDRTTPHAFNRGVAAANGDLVVIVGAHSCLDERFVESIVRAFDETEADVVGGCIETQPATPKSVAIAAAQTSRLGTGGAAYRAPGLGRIEADTVPFPAFSKRLWERVGGFDEELLRNQDDEFILRVRQAGGRVLLDPDVRAIYFARSSLRGLWKQYFGYGRFRILTVRKRGRPGSLRPFAPLSMVVLLLTAILLSIRHRAWLTLPSLYLAACVAEGGRLSKFRSIEWVRTTAALLVMHWAYGLGEWYGLFEQTAGRQFGSKGSS